MNQSSNFGYLSLVYKWMNFIFKICLTVAGISMNHHYFLFDLDYFWLAFCHLGQLWGRGMGKYLKKRHIPRRFDGIFNAKIGAVVYCVTTYIEEESTGKKCIQNDDAWVVKGQLISEWLLDVFIWNKKRTKIFLYFCPTSLK